MMLSFVRYDEDCTAPAATAGWLSRHSAVNQRCRSRQRDPFSAW
jgi:hypothetical protein